MEAGEGCGFEVWEAGGCEDVLEKEEVDGNGICCSSEVAWREELKLLIVNKTEHNGLKPIVHISHRLVGTITVSFF